MLSELATNAVRHAGSEYVVSVRVAADGHEVLVEVSDGAGGYPVPQDPTGDAPHGRGLHTVLPGRSRRISMPQASASASHDVQPAPVRRVRGRSGGVG